MAQDTSLGGLRRGLITQIYGPRLALGPGNSSDSNAEYLVGIRALREQVEGVSSAGSTITTTSPAAGQALSAYGISLVGATAASASTAYTLNLPVPGTVKRIFNPTTGQVVINTGAAFICSTASVTSTQATITMVGKGAYVELWGLTTALWGLAENLAITTVTTGNLVQIG